MEIVQSLYILYMYVYVFKEELCKDLSKFGHTEYNPIHMSQYKNESSKLRILVFDHKNSHVLSELIC